MGLKVTKVTTNYKGIGKVLRSAQTRKDLTGRAQRVLASAKASAPVATGEYRDGLHIEQDTHPTRAVVRVAGDTDHDFLVEADTGNLARALDQARGG